MLQAGIKENVLPSTARAVVNFRILPGETPQSVTLAVRRITNDSKVQISEPGLCFAPSEEADTGSAAFTRLANTIAEVFPGVLITPGLVVGATDSRHYSGLTKNILRFMPVRLGSVDMKRIHGVDERIGIEDFRQCIRFYHRLLSSASQ